VQVTSAMFADDGGVLYVLGTERTPFHGVTSGLPNADGPLLKGESAAILRHPVAFGVAGN
jgi:hypothetical protein